MIIDARLRRLEAAYPPAASDPTAAVLYLPDNGRTAAVLYLPDNGRDGPDEPPRVLFLPLKQSQGSPDDGGYRCRPPGVYPMLGGATLVIYDATNPNCPFRPPPDPRFPTET